VLSDEKILITGPAGTIAYGLAESLVANNEVWGIARFSDPASRVEVDELGVVTRVVDLGSGDFGDLPTDFTYVLHLAVAYEQSYDTALRVNGEGTGFVLQHCRNAKAALVMSTMSVYKPHPNPLHAFREDDPLGENQTMYSPPYSVSKIAQEAVARSCCRSFGLPVTIARMNAAYGNRGGLMVNHIDLIAAGKPVPTRHDPMLYSVIHDDDIAAQIEPLLAAASVPATIVNWGGDEQVSVQEWTAYVGELLGVATSVEVSPVLGASVGSIADCSKRLALTGPSTVHWKNGVRRVVEHRYPDRVVR
jgi:nucleoside-diphosphate-sugar epimerase